MTSLTTALLLSLKFTDEFGGDELIVQPMEDQWKIQHCKKYTAN